MLLFLATQYGFGLAAALSVHLPPLRSSADASSLLVRTTDNVLWAIGHGGLSLSVHAALGIVIVLLSVGLIGVLCQSDRATLTAAALGAALVGIAAACGAGFLNTRGAFGSDWMGSCMFAAGLTYLVVYVRCATPSKSATEPESLNSPDPRALRSSGFRRKES
jgi:hypothetical protein